MTAVLARHEVELLMAYRGLRAACNREDRAFVTRATIAHVNRTTRAMYNIKRKARLARWEADAAGEQRNVAA